MNLHITLESKLNFLFSKGNLEWPNDKDIHLIRTRVYQKQTGLLDKAHLYGFFSPELYKEQNILANSLFFKIVAVHELRIPCHLRRYTREKISKDNLRLSLLDHMSLKLKKTGKEFKYEQDFSMLVDLAIRNLINLVLEPLIVHSWSSCDRSSEFKRYKKRTLCEIKEQLIQTRPDSSKAHNNILELYLTRDIESKTAISWILRNLPLYQKFLPFVCSWLANGLLEKALSLTPGRPTFQVEQFSLTLLAFLLRDLRTTITDSVNLLKFKRKLNFAYSESNFLAIKETSVYCMHYGNHVVFITHSSYVMDRFLKLVLTQFLGIRGLLSSLQNVRSYRTDSRNEKLNFLGYTFSNVSNPKFSRQVLEKNCFTNIKIVVYPQSAERIKLLRKLKVIFKRSQNLGAYDLICKLNPILQEWLSYYNDNDSVPCRAKIKNSLYYLIWSWASTKHKGWNKELIAKTYFRITIDSNFRSRNKISRSTSGFFGIKDLKLVYLIDPTKFALNNCRKEST